MVNAEALPPFQQEQPPFGTVLELPAQGKTK
jgi:hypothetical protein